MFKKIKRRLAYQLSLNIMAAIFVLVLVIALSAGTYVFKTIERELQIRLASEQRLATEQIETLFDSSATRVRQMGLDLSIQTYLKEVKTREDVTDHPLYPHVLQMLKAIQLSDDEIFLAWVANLNGNFYLDGNGIIPNEEYRVVNRPWYNVALSKPGVNFTRPYVEWGTGRLVISSIQALYENNINYGFTVIDFQLNRLPEFVQNINVGKNGKVMIVDQFGAFIYHPDNKKVLEHHLSRESSALNDYVSNLDDQVVSFGRLKIDDRSYYVSTRKHPLTQWTCIALVSQEEIMSSLYAYFAALTLALIILSIILVLVVTKIVQRKLEPINALKAYAAQIADGKIEEQPPYHYAHRIDEMGDMARSFVTITEVFKQKNALLQEIVSAQYDEIQKQYHYILEKEKIASLGTLVAGVAHEINTPLGVGVTTASFIQDSITQLASDYQQKILTEREFNVQLASLIEASTLLQTNLKRAADLVVQFKSVATNQNIEQLTLVNLATEIDNVITSLGPNFKHRMITIVNDCDSRVVMTTYPGALTQIFTNLIMNSLHHGFDEEDVGLISIEARVDGELVRITYADNGKGIEQGVLDHIFEPFFTTRRHMGNSGLGMYIMHNLITATLSGNITVESQVQKGTQFHLLFPLHLKQD